ncbi:hypothetical protein DRQ50_02715 [bacterium]|nr:MAG: hypothetical protein DRQ50_02715 [bacterium]
MTTPQGKHLFINLASGEPAHAAKALRQGRNFIAGNWEVTLMLNVDAVTLVGPAAGQTNCPVSGKPLDVMLAGFAAAGGCVLVGADCLKLAGFAVDDLPAGCAIGTFEEVERRLGRPGTRTLCW